jgi:hypothetical protein
MKDIRQLPRGFVFASAKFHAQRLYITFMSTAGLLILLAFFQYRLITLIFFTSLNYRLYSCNVQIAYYGGSPNCSTFALKILLVDNKCTNFFNGSMIGNCSADGTQLCMFISVLFLLIL